MQFFWIAGGIVLALAALFFLVTYLIFYIAFHAWPDKKPADGYDLPAGKVYEPFHPQMRCWADERAQLPHQDFSITSFDGLTLWGTYYEYAPGAPIELMFHGYRGNAHRDLGGGIQRCFSLGRSAFIVDQRTSGRSGGKVISFGINESRDCRAWVDFMIGHFGPDVKIILTGISMGASTVMLAAGRELPPNVIGALADCGYTSAKEIIKKVIRQVHLPADLLYPVVKFSAKLYGGFDLEEDSPMEAMGRSTVPMIFAHGEADDFVPCDMSRANYEACTAPKTLVTVPGAGHGLSYPMDPEAYLSTLREFDPVMGINTEVHR